MAYRNTFQADALMLVGKKLQSSLAVEGELPEDGLAAYGDEGDDLMLALARKIVADDAGEESVEDVFAQAQQVAADAEVAVASPRGAVARLCEAGVLTARAGMHVKVPQGSRAPLQLSNKRGWTP